MVTVAPELSYDLDVTDSDGKWVRRGNHAIWAGSRKADDPQLVMHEWSERGVRPFPLKDDKPVFHRVPGGTPYHISHLFGFWVVNDVDAMLLTAKRGGDTYYMLTVGGRTDGAIEASCLFVCPKCAARFGEAKYTELRGGYDRFMDFALQRVRAFNAHAGQRTCPKCGAVHPPIYGFRPDEDTSDERRAREAG